MKKLLLITVIAFGFISCESKAGTGAIAGGVLGAGVGGIIGGGQGALIGSAVGVASGALVGAALDEQDREIMQKTSPRTVDRMDKHEPLTIHDIIKLSQGGVSDETIIRYIDDTRTTYNLTQAQVNRMKAAGVSRRVINYMINTGQ